MCPRNLLVQLLQLQLGKLRIGREMKVKSCLENQRSLEASAPATVPGPDSSQLEEEGAAGELATTRAGPFRPLPPARTPSSHLLPRPQGRGSRPRSPWQHAAWRPQPPHRRAVHLAPSPPQLGGLRLSLLGTGLLSGGIHSSPTGDQSPGQQRQVPAPPGTTKMTNCWAQEVDQKPPGSTFSAEGRNTFPVLQKAARNSSVLRQGVAFWRQ